MRWKQPALGLDIEIDDHVAAEDDIERAAHRPIVHEIQLLEGDQLLERGRYFDRALK